MRRRVLITGASVAGNAAAWWLSRSGAQVTVVEKSPSFRSGGQNVDIRERALEVVERMGLLQEAARRGTGETGMALVRRDGRRFAQFDVGGFTADYEILRDDLARMIYEPASASAEYVFGDAITAITERADAALVTFASGRAEDYDAVIVAEGVGSSTRDLLFPGENKPHYLNMTLAYFTIPNGANDSQVARWYPAKGGISILVRPDRHGTTRAFMLVQGPPGHQEKLSMDEQKAFIRRRFANAGWETDRILAGMERSRDFYFDVVRQVRMDRWSSGRVALTGDAAWCATPLSGMGSSLAIIGGYILAGEMSRTEDLTRAFAGYERVMRPFIAKYQPVSRFVPRLLHPRTAAGLWLQRQMIGTLASAPVKKLASKLSGRPTAPDPLPAY